MKQINYNRSADLRPEPRIKHGKDVETPCSMGTLSQLSINRLCQESRLIDIPESAHNFKGFFISAVCEYARDNQRNDTSVSATRTNAGSNGGRRIEPAWECVRLFSQPFEPIAQDTCKSVLAVTRDGSVERTQAERNQLVLAWDELCLHSGFTIERYN